MMMFNGNFMLNMDGSVAGGVPGPPPGTPTANMAMVALKPGEVILRKLFHEFTILADKKIDHVLTNEPLDRSLSKSLQRGEDPLFDQLLTAFGTVAEHCLPSQLRVLFEWHERQLKQTSMCFDEFFGAAGVCGVEGCSAAGGGTTATFASDTSISSAPAFTGIGGSNASGGGGGTSSPLPSQQIPGTSSSAAAAISSSAPSSTFGHHLLHHHRQQHQHHHNQQQHHPHHHHHQHQQPSSSLLLSSSSPIDSQTEMELNYLLEKRDLAIEFIFCLVLIEVLRQLPLHPGYDELTSYIENLAFKHFKFREDAQTNPNLININIIADLYAEVIGVLAQTRFQSVRKRFMLEFKELRARDPSPILTHSIISLLMGMKFFRVKMVPIEEFEASFQFMHECALYFLDVKDKDIKHALAGLFVEILVPVAATVKNEVNITCLKNFVELLYSSTLDLCTKKKHCLALFPLVTCLLCVSQKQFFLSNWHYFLAMCLSHLKNRDAKMSRVALESLYRLLWVYMIRIKCESNTATQSRLHSIVNSLFPKGSKAVVPRNTPLNIFVKIIQFIAQERLDFAMRDIVFDLLSVGRSFKIIITPERMSIGLRSFLVVADSLQQKDGEPPMPRTLGVLPSGNTLRVKKTFLNKMLTDEMAKNIGMNHYYPYVRKTLADILRALDVQFGRPLMKTTITHGGSNKEADELLSGERKPKIDLFRTCIAAIPRLLPEGLSKNDLIDLLARLTVHMDEEMCALAFQSLQNLVVDFVDWREDVIDGFVHFVLYEIADHHQCLIETALRMLFQLLTSWRNAIQQQIGTTTTTTGSGSLMMQSSTASSTLKTTTAAASTTSTTTTASSSMTTTTSTTTGTTTTTASAAASNGKISTSEQSTLLSATLSPGKMDQIATVLYKVDALALVMLCYCRQPTRKLAAMILKESRTISSLLTTWVSTTYGVAANLYDEPTHSVIDSNCSTIVQHCFPYLSPGERATIISLSYQIDLQWLAERNGSNWVQFDRLSDHNLFSHTGGRRSGGGGSSGGSAGNGLRGGSHGTGSSGVGGGGGGTNTGGNSGTDSGRSSLSSMNSVSTNASSSISGVGAASSGLSSTGGNGGDSGNVSTGQLSTSSGVGSVATSNSITSPSSSTTTGGGGGTGAGGSGTGAGGVNGSNIVSGSSANDHTGTTINSGTGGGGKTRLTNTTGTGGGGGGGGGGTTGGNGGGGTINDTNQLKLNAWNVCLMQMIQNVMQHCPRVTNYCWQYVFHRLKTLFAQIDPNPVNDNRSAASILRGSTSSSNLKQRISLFDRSFYIELWKNYLMMACCVAPSSIVPPTPIVIPGRNNVSAGGGGGTGAGGDDIGCISPDSSLAEAAKAATTPAATLDGTRSPVIASRGRGYSVQSLFKLVIEHIRSEQIDLRNAVILGLAQVNAHVLADLIEELSPLLKETIDRKQENVRRRKRRELLRIQIGRLLQYISARGIIAHCPAVQLDARDSNSLGNTLLEYIDGVRVYFEQECANTTSSSSSSNADDRASSSATSSSLTSSFVMVGNATTGLGTSIGVVGSSVSGSVLTGAVGVGVGPSGVVVGGLSSSITGASAITPTGGVVVGGGGSSGGTDLIYDIKLCYGHFVINLLKSYPIGSRGGKMSDEMRQNLFNLFASWSGKYGQRFLLPQQQHHQQHVNYNFAYEPFSITNEIASAAVGGIVPLNELELLSLRAMSTILCAGALFDTTARSLLDGQPLYQWLTILLASPDSRIHEIGLETLILLLENNLDQAGPLLDWTVECCYTRCPRIADACFIALATLFTIREYPVDRYIAIVIVTIVNVACARIEIQQMALQLLQILDNRFFTGNVPLYSSTITNNTSASTVTATGGGGGKMSDSFPGTSMMTRSSGVGASLMVDTNTATTSGGNGGGSSPRMLMSANSGSYRGTGGTNTLSGNTSASSATTVTATALQSPPQQHSYNGSTTIRHSNTNHNQFGGGGTIFNDIPEPLLLNLYPCSQENIAKRMASLHPQLTMIVFSEITYRFQLARPSVCRNLLEFLIPWLYNMQLVDPTTATYQQYQQHEEDSGGGSSLSPLSPVVSSQQQHLNDMIHHNHHHSTQHHHQQHNLTTHFHLDTTMHHHSFIHGTTEGWGSIESTEMVLNNLFYITIKFGDDYPSELEHVWSALCVNRPNNLKIIIRYLFILTGLSPNELLSFTKRIATYLARAQPEYLLDILMSELQTVEFLNFNAERTEAFPYFRIVNRKSSATHLTTTTTTATAAAATTTTTSNQPTPTSATVNSSQRQQLESSASSDDNPFTDGIATTTTNATTVTAATLTITGSSGSNATTNAAVTPVVMMTMKPSTPQPRPLPMPEYGGYYAPLNTFLAPSASYGSALMYIGGGNFTTTTTGCGFHRCNLALMLLSDIITQDMPSMVDWSPHIPLMLHILFLGLDHSKAIVYEHCKQLLLNLLIVTTKHQDYLNIARVLLNNMILKKNYGLGVPFPYSCTSVVAAAAAAAAAAGGGGDHHHLQESVDNGDGNGDDDDQQQQRSSSPMNKDGGGGGGIRSNVIYHHHQRQQRPQLQTPQYRLRQYHHRHHNQHHQQFNDQLSIAEWQKASLDIYTITLIDFISSKQGVALWNYEDITAKVWHIRSEEQMACFVEHVLGVFHESLPYAKIANRWAEIALQLALRCSSRHYAGRSLQIFRALKIPINNRMLSDILTRLVETISEPGDDMQGYVTELMLTLESAIDSFDLKPRNIYELINEYFHFDEQTDELDDSLFDLTGGGGVGGDRISTGIGGGDGNRGHLDSSAGGGGGGRRRYRNRNSSIQLDTISQDLLNDSDFQLPPPVPQCSPQQQQSQQQQTSSTPKKNHQQQSSSSPPPPSSSPLIATSDTGGGGGSNDHQSAVNNNTSTSTTTMTGISTSQSQTDALSLLSKHGGGGKFFKKFPLRSTSYSMSFPTRKFNFLDDENKQVITTRFRTTTDVDQFYGQQPPPQPPSSSSSMVVDGSGGDRTSTSPRPPSSISSNVIKRNTNNNNPTTARLGRSQSAQSLMKTTTITTSPITVVNGGNDDDDDVNDCLLESFDNATDDNDDGGAADQHQSPAPQQQHPQKPPFNDNVTVDGMMINMTQTEEDDKTIILAQFFWIAVILLDSDYEHEFALALRLLDRVLDKISLDDPDTQEKIEKIFIHFKWCNFPGVHALLLKGLASTVNYDATIHLLHKFTPMLKIPVIDPTKSEQSFPFHIMAMLPYMLHNYDEPNELCIQTAISFANWCNENLQTKLENLATVMTLYSKRCFSKENSQWIKCVVKYLYDVYPHSFVPIIAFLVETAEKGPAVFQHYILSILHFMLNYLDLSIVRLNNVDILRLTNKYIETLQWKEVLKILKLIVSRSSSLATPSMYHQTMASYHHSSIISNIVSTYGGGMMSLYGASAPGSLSGVSTVTDCISLGGVGGGSSIGDSLGTGSGIGGGSSDSFGSSLKQRELPGRTMDFSFDLSQTPIVGLKYIQKRQQLWYSRQVLEDPPPPPAQQQQSLDVEVGDGSSMDNTGGQQQQQQKQGGKNLTSPTSRLPLEQLFDQQQQTSSVVSTNITTTTATTTTTTTAASTLSQINNNGTVGGGGGATALKQQPTPNTNTLPKRPVSAQTRIRERLIGLLNRCGHPIGSLPKSPSVIFSQNSDIMEHNKSSVASSVEDISGTQNDLSIGDGSKHDTDVIGGTGAGSSGSGGSGTAGAGAGEGSVVSGNNDNTIGTDGNNSGSNNGGGGAGTDSGSVTGTTGDAGNTTTGSPGGGGGDGGSDTSTTGGGGATATTATNDDNDDTDNVHDTGENFVPLFKEFDFLEYELESQEGESLDNFNWGVRRKSLSNLEQQQQLLLQMHHQQQHQLQQSETGSGGGGVSSNHSYSTGTLRTLSKGMMMPTLVVPSSSSSTTTASTTSATANVTNVPLIITTQDLQHTNTTTTTTATTTADRVKSIITSATSITTATSSSSSTAIASTTSSGGDGGGVMKKLQSQHHLLPKDLITPTTDTYSSDEEVESVSPLYDGIGGTGETTIVTTLPPIASTTTAQSIRTHHQRRSSSRPASLISADSSHSLGSEDGIRSSVVIGGGGSGGGSSIVGSISPNPLSMVPQSEMEMEVDIEMMVDVDQESEVGSGVSGGGGGKHVTICSGYGIRNDDGGRNESGVDLWSAQFTQLTNDQTGTSCAMSNQILALIFRNVFTRMAEIDRECCELVPIMNLDSNTEHQPSQLHRTLAIKLTELLQLVTKPVDFPFVFIDPKLFMSDFKLLNGHRFALLELQNHWETFNEKRQQLAQSIGRCHKMLRSLGDTLGDALLVSAICMPLYRTHFQLFLIFDCYLKFLQLLKSIAQLPEVQNYSSEISEIKRELARCLATMDPHTTTASDWFAGSESGSECGFNSLPIESQSLTKENEQELKELIQSGQYAKAVRLVHVFKENIPDLFSDDCIEAILTIYCRAIFDNQSSYLVITDHTAVDEITRKLREAAYDINNLSLLTG